MPRNNTRWDDVDPAGQDHRAIEQAALDLGIDPSIWPIFEVQPKEVIDVVPRSDLSDAEWRLLSSLIPLKYLNRPNGPARYRNAFNAMLWLQGSHAFENHLPARYGHYNAFRKLREGMAARGDMQTILDALPALGLSGDRVAALTTICRAAIGNAHRLKALRSR